MYVVINPFTLTFSERELEREYIKRRYKDCLLPVEKRYVIFDFIQFGVFLIFRIIKGECCSMLEAIPVIWGASTAFFHLIFARFIKSEGEQEYEIMTTALIKTSKVIGVSIGIFLWPMNPENKGLWYTILLRGGVVLNISFGLGLPLMFKENTILQFILTIAASFIGIQTTCDVILNNSATHGRFLRVWEFTNRILMIVLDQGMFTNNTTVENNPSMLCFHYLSILYFILSFCLPTLLLWHLELRSRQEFILEKRIQEGRTDLDMDSTILPEMSFSILGRRSLF